MIRRDFIKGAFTGGVFGGVNVPSQASSPSEVGETRKKPRIMFYHDGRHPLIYMYEPPMQKEEYEAAVDELAGTPIEVVMFAMGDGRTVLHDTQVGELWGHNVKRWPHLIFRRAYQNAKGLIQGGNDPLRIVIERAHVKGMLLYPVLLVQQGTGQKGSDVRASEFRFQNRHLEIGAAGGLPKDFPDPNGLDFKHDEVRDERFALIQETLTRYPVDGLELQMNYGRSYFRPEEVSAGRPVLSDWIERIHRAVKKSGAQRELAIRIPADLEKCYSLGLDVVEWIRRGRVDVLIAESPLGGKLVDQGTNFGPLVKTVQGSECRLHAVLHNFVDSDRLGRGTIPVVRATACNYWEQGVDGLYLAQWFDHWPYQASFYEMVRELPHPDIMAAKDKFYFAPTISGRYYKRRITGMQLPADLQLNIPEQVELVVSDDLPRWDRVGRVHEVILRLRVRNHTELDRLAFRLNGKLLPESSLRKINGLYRMSAPRFRVSNSYWYIFRLDRKHWPLRGRNTVEVMLTQRDPDVTPQIHLRDVELEIKYLLGKNFHRGEADPDLGPAINGEIS